MSMTQLHPGDVVRLGAYPQGPNGEVQPIEWQVLELAEGRALVLSRHVLDLMSYHSEAAIVRWEDSRMRRWLREDFMPAAFSEDDLSHIYQPEEEDDPAGEMIWRLFGMEAKTDSLSDPVFLLSNADIARDFPNKDELFYSGAGAAMTAWAAANHPDVDEMYGNVNWWLRSSFNNEPFAYIFSLADSIGVSRVGPDNAQGVRPAMWVVTE